MWAEDQWLSRNPPGLWHRQGLLRHQSVKLSKYQTLGLLWYNATVVLFQSIDQADILHSNKCAYSGLSSDCRNLLTFTNKCVHAHMCKCILWCVCSMGCSSRELYLAGMARGTLKQLI